MNTLNAKFLVDEGIITGPIGEDNLAQHGVDLNVVKIEAMSGSGFIPAKGKTQLVNYVECPLVENDNEEGGKSWFLIPGAYSVTFAQGCKIPANQMLLIRQRSSLLRNGALLHSSVFDAGFETEQIGTVIVVHQPIEIEYNARIAQIYGHECTPVENLYDGQFQNDKQRANG